MLAGRVGRSKLDCKMMHPGTAPPAAVVTRCSGVAKGKKEMMNDSSLHNSAGACNLHFTWLPGYVMGNAIGEEGRARRTG